MMPANRIWVNVPKGGDTVFVTAGTLEAANVFGQPALRDIVATTLIDVCSMSETQLHAFAVLPHVLHFIGKTVDYWEVADLIKRIKQEVSKQVVPLLTEESRQSLAASISDVENLIWTRSYRSIVIRTPKVLKERIDYIHQMPVHVGLSETPEAYRWSSARAYLDGMRNEEGFLDLAYLYGQFGP